MKRAIALGQLMPGDQLPTVKQLALRLIINPNTVAKAYRDLEKEGILETFPGRGSFVAASMVEGARQEQLAKLTQDMRRLIMDAAALGITSSALAEQFEREVREWYGRESSVVSHRDT